MPLEIFEQKKNQIWHTFLKKSSGRYIEGRFYINIRNKETSYEFNPVKEIGHAQGNSGRHVKNYKV